MSAHILTFSDAARLASLRRSIAARDLCKAKLNIEAVLDGLEHNDMTRGEMEQAFASILGRIHSAMGEVMK